MRSLLLFIAVVLCSSQAAFGDGNEPPGGIAGVAALEVQKRQHRVKSAQTLFTGGSKAFADRSYGEAMDYFKLAFETMPAVPAVADQRRIFFKRYQEAAVQFTKVLISEAKWTEAETTLVDVMATAKVGSVPDVLILPEVKTILKDLRERDDRYNFALSPQHLRAAEEVQQQLILGKGHLDLGDYDRAERAYNKALTLDPYNTAARRGLENVERHKMNYFDAAYDHTRSKMLREVAAGWETPVPPAAIGGGVIEDVSEVAPGRKIQLQEKLKSIRIPQIEVNQATLADVLQILTQKSQELDTAEPDPLKKGVNIVLDNSGSLDGQDPSQKLVSFKLTNVPLEVALKYATQKVGMTYRVDSFAVTVLPEGLNADAALVTRTYIVPPGFISAGGGDPAGGGGNNDPFADPVDDGGGLVKRITAKEFLEQNGVKFGDGASANYSAATSKLVVRNTDAQQETVRYLIESARASGNKMVQINVKMISIEQEFLRQAGMDWLLGQSNLGSTPRVFVGGGTDGNATIPVAAGDFPFVAPNGNIVGTHPITSGLRTGTLSSTQTIDDVITRTSAAPQLARAPGVFSVSGVFTDPQFQTVLRALSQLKGTDQLCDINVLARPGQVATIEQAREFIYPTEYDPPEIPNQFGGGSIPVTPATPTAFETRKLGKILEVEATVGADNQTINVNVIADFTEFVGFINYGTPINDGGATLFNGVPGVVTENEILMPVFDAIKETTNVSVWDGQTIAIGGLHGESITASQDKVPFLGDLPVLGRAFRSSTKDSLKQALTIFVSVRLVDPAGNPINVVRDPDDLVSRDEYTPPTRSVSPVLGPPAGMPYPSK